MKRGTKKVMLGALACLLVFGIAGTTLAEAETKPVTMVVVVEEDYSLTDDSGNNYPLAENDKADELADHIGKRVEIKGMLEESADGAQTITIESYKLME